MGRRIISLLLILIFLLTMTSCVSSALGAIGGWSRYVIEYPNQMFSVDTVSVTDTEYDAKYDGKLYNCDEYHLFESMLKANFRSHPIEECIPEGDVLISWNTLPLGLWYLDRYYSYSYDNPVFIYEIRLDRLYLREDYSYETDTFVIEGTDQSFVFSDMLALSHTKCTCSLGNHYNSTIITLYSKAYPRLRMELRVFCENDTWFAHTTFYASPVFEVSEEFIKILSDNGIITT